MAVASYSTAFSGTENPLSESGAWTNGLATGLDWTNVRCTPGLAFGTQVPHATPPFDDSIACLSGFGPDQWCQLVISNPGNAAVLREVELHLHKSITAHTSTGYEIDITTNFGLNIVRWDTGSSFTSLGTATTGVTLNDGDVWYAQIIGSVITVMCNGVIVWTGSDSTYTTGNPGLGFYADTDNGTPSSATSFGISSFSAGDFPGIKRVGGTGNVVADNATSWTGTHTFTAGNLGIVELSAGGLGSPPYLPTSVTDNLGGTWTVVSNGTTNSESQCALVAYRENLPSGVTSVTAAFAPGSYISGGASEWSGVATSSSLRTSNDSTGATPNTSPAITVAVGDLVIGVAVSDDNANTPWTTGLGWAFDFNFGDSSTGTPGAAVYQIAASTSVSATLGYAPAATNVTTLIAAFKPASGGASTFFQSPTFTTAVTLSLKKRPGINRSLTSANTSVLLKQPRKTLSITSGTTTTLGKRVGKTFAVTSAVTTALVRSIHRFFAVSTAASLTFAEGLLKKTTLSVSTTATVAMTQKAVATQLFSLTTAATVGVIKSISKVLVAAISGATVAVVKRVTKVPFTVTTGATVSLTEQLSLHKTFGVLTAVTVGFALTKVKQLVFSITTAVSLAFTATFIPATVITLTAGRKIIRQLFNFLARR